MNFMLWQKIYADSIDELVNGEIEKYIQTSNILFV